MHCGLEDIVGQLKSVIAGVLLIGFVGFAEADTQQVSVQQFDAWMDEVSNWGRWGADDELGALNLITPEKRKAAAALVQDGVTVSLALDLNKTKDDLNVNPFQHELSVLRLDGHEAAVDRYSVDYHGYAHSHIDGLTHFAHKGKMYNGVPLDALKPNGAEKLGIENASAGIFTRGLLVDVAWLKGVDYLEPDTVIMAEDLEAWEAKTGIRVGSGDVLLVRTGRWERVRQKGQWDLSQGAAGMHASVAKWLHARDVAVLGCDGISDAVPSNVATKPNALHALALVGMGMLILDNLDLDELAQAVQQRNRPEFLFVGAPLRVPGGTGSPLNPLAVF
jgi:kynurenine formamidase